VELTPRIPEKRDEDVPVFVRRVKRRPEVFAVVLSISSLEFGEVLQIPTLPFDEIQKAVVSQELILLVLKAILHPVPFCQI
jgi:hypothetical protein